MRTGCAFMRAPQVFSDSCQSATSASISVYDFFSAPILKLMRALVASRYGNAGRRSDRVFWVGAAGIWALRSSKAVRFQRPAWLRTMLMLGSVALRVAISIRPRSSERKRIAAVTSCARIIGSAL